MARIRTIKPGFWDSPDVARASAVARLTYIAMWCWADDYGVGTANPKELEGFVFPYDDVEDLTHGNARNFRDILTEVADVFGVAFYSVRGRPYYAIPSWNEHQKIERRAKTRNPTPEDADEPLTWENSGGTEMHGSSASLARKPADVQAPEREEEEEREEEGEDIVAESDDSDEDDEKPDPNDRDDIRQLLDYLDAAIANTDPQAKLPTRSKYNKDAARLLLDNDGRTAQQVQAAIDFARNDEFWRTNINSMKKLREKYDTLRLQAQRSQTKAQTQQYASASERRLHAGAERLHRKAQKQAASIDQSLLSITDGKVIE